MKRFLTASLILVLAFSASTQASFQYSATRINNAFTSGGKSYDRIQFKVLNDGTAATATNGTIYSSTGTKILAMETNIESSARMRFESVDNGHDFLDVNLVATNASTMNTTQFTKYNPAVFLFNIVNALVPLPSPVSTATYNAAGAYASTLTLTQFTGAALGIAPVANVTPFNFLSVVVESGATVRSFGLVGGDQGGAQGIPAGPEADVRFAMNITSAVPEPTTLGVIASVGRPSGQ